VFIFTITFLLLTAATSDPYTANVFLYAQTTQHHHTTPQHNN